METMGQQTFVRVTSKTIEKTKIDPFERGEMIEKYAPMIHSIAARIFSRIPSHHGIDLDDLVNTGVIGFIDALNKYDPGKNIEFKTYAEYRVRGAILDELRSVDHVPRSLRQKAHQLEKAVHFLQQKYGRSVEDEEVAAFLKLDMDEYYALLSEVGGVSLISVEDLGIDLADPEEVLKVDRNPYLQLRINEVKAILTSAIDELPEKERLVVTLYYYEELNMKEVGEVLGLTESRVSQLHSKALIRLKKRLKRIPD